VTKNERAFLDMIAWAELGPQLLADSDRGYNVLVGSIPGRERLFFDYSDHPRILVKINDDLYSTAAGRYQILRRIFDHYRQTLHLPDFSPASQDAIAIQLIRERRGLPAIASGQIATAIHLCRSVWASLPGAGYGQHEHLLDYLLAAYTAAGGTIA